MYVHTCTCTCWYWQSKHWQDKQQIVFFLFSNILRHIDVYNIFCLPGIWNWPKVGYQGKTCVTIFQSPLLLGHKMNVKWLFFKDYLMYIHVLPCEWERSFLILLNYLINSTVSAITDNEINFITVHCSFWRA